MKNDRPSNRKNMAIYVIPNLFTTANLFCGFYSIIASMKGMHEVAALAIIIAVILDGMDGRIARMTRTTSHFGAEYDSLCDLVSFGAAPAIMAYNWSLFSFGKWGWIVAFLFVVCGALRLARFNVQVGIVDNKVFNGLPIPGGALVLATSVLLFYYLGGEGRYPSLPVMIGVMVVAIFMVSSIKYYSFKDLNYFSRKPFMSFVMIVLIFIIVAAEPQIMLFTFAFGYSLTGPAYALFKLLRKRFHVLETEHSVEDHHRFL
jgi:CDP-diacylglycerol---serine O-phosphatidyltransferase